MRLRVADLWTWRGTVDRGPFVILGLGLFFIKYNLDRWLVRSMTGKEWIPLHYWVPGDFFGLATPNAQGAGMTLPLVLTSLPFIWAGVMLTLRRLRSIGYPGGAVVFFFVPVLNIFFFLALALLPPHPDVEPREGAWLRWLGGMIPRSRLGSACFAAGVTALPVLGLVVLGTEVLGKYGWGLFIGIPFVLGFLSAVLHGYHEPKSLVDCIVVSMLSLCVSAVALLAFAIEGLICILMASPIAAAVGLFGSLIGFLVQQRERRGPTVLAVLLGLPLVLGAEAAVEPPPPVLEVTTTADVAAAPAVVWRHVVSFAELPPPRETIFRTGLAYPIRAEIRGRGAGAVRHCVFSTGPFVEPITVWDEPRELAFDVTAQPAPMEEWSP
ncbi:MAG TPA: DUF805 domain-containing protein [Planctomycetota bacterium]|nr:DUF805 domain-containing protein [Planctomycetota bacterium]